MGSFYRKEADLGNGDFHRHISMKIASTSSLNEGGTTTGVTAMRQPTTILVTGVGGGVGQSIIKCLTGAGVRVIGADASEQAAGLYSVDKAVLVPRASDPDYSNRLLAICRSEHVRVIFPGLDLELPVLARDADLFLKEGIRPIISSPEVVRLCDDKFETALFLKRHGFPTPRTVRLDVDDPRTVAFPMVLKPRTGGSRSWGVFFVRNEEELAHRLPMIDRRNYVAQELIDGDEYTCGTVNFDGTTAGPIVMKRFLRDGDTHKAFVVRNPAMEEHVSSAARKLGALGSCNFQLRLRDGVPFIFEINARCSGTTHARALAGFNEPRMILEYLREGRFPCCSIREICILRYWQELVVDYASMESLRRSGSLERAVVNP